MKRRRLWAGTALLACTLAAGGWAAVLIARAGLDDADKLSSVLGGAVAVVCGVAALWVAIRARQEARQPPPQPQPDTGAGPVQINSASGQATVYGVQGGNLTIGEPAAPSDRQPDD